MAEDAGVIRAVEMTERQKAPETREPAREGRMPIPGSGDIRNDAESFARFDLTGDVVEGVAKAVAVFIKVPFDTSVQFPLRRMRHKFRE